MRLNFNASSLMSAPKKFQSVHLLVKIFLTPPAMRATNRKALLQHSLWLQQATTFSPTRTLSTSQPSYTASPPIKPWPQRLHPKRLVSMITRQQNLDLALQIFNYATQHHTYDTYTSIITRLSRARAFSAVEDLLAQLQSSGIKCGEQLFIIVIRNYGLAGKPNMCLKTFMRVERFNGVNRSVRSFNTLLNALVQNKKYYLVYCLVKCCKEKFGLRPNLFTCNILVKALCKRGDVEGAVKVLDEMPEMGLVPSVVSYTTVLGGYVARGDMESAKRVFGEVLDKGWSPDAMTYTVLMDGYVKLGRLGEAIKVMDDMEENGVEANEVTYGIMIEGFCKEKRSGEAVNLINDMLENRYVPSSALCCKVIDVLCEEGKVDDACKLWKKLLSKNCTPDNAISSTLIYWLCNNGKVWEAKRLFDEFEKSSIPSLLTYNALIAGLCEKGELCEAGRLWDDMVEKECHPNAYTYNMLIKGFCKLGKPEEGIRTLEEMLDKGCRPNKTTYSILVEGLSNFEMKRELAKVIKTATYNF